MLSRHTSAVNRRKVSLDRTADGSDNPSTHRPCSGGPQDQSDRECRRERTRVGHRAELLPIATPVHDVPMPCGDGVAAGDQMQGLAPYDHLRLWGGVAVLWP